MDRCRIILRIVWHLETIDSQDENAALFDYVRAYYEVMLILVFLILRVNGIGSGLLEKRLPIRIGILVSLMEKKEDFAMF